MDINNQFNQELLSAYLDDKLTAAELAQVETWLATDPSAVSYLDELRSNRHTLKAMANLPGLTLKSSLAARVLAQTHAVEAQPAAVQLPPVAQEPRSKQWWAWGSLAATAAAITWLAVLPMMQPTKQQSLVSQIETAEVGPGPDDVAANPPRSSHEILDATVPVLPNETIPGGATPGGIAIDSGNSSPDEQQGIVKLPFQLLLIADVLVKPQAWDDGKFDQLLEKYDIRYEKALVAKPTLIKGLIESQVTVGADADPASQQDAALVYVDCPAKSLEKLLVDIENDGEHFVGMKYNTAMGGGDLGFKGPYESMLNALREQTGPSRGRGIARLIVPTQAGGGSNLLPAFDVPVRNTEQELRDKARQQTSSGTPGMGNLQIENDSSESLFILRKQ